MAAILLLYGRVLSLWTYFARAEDLNEIVGILKGRTEFLKARVEDINRGFFYADIRRGKKRKREDDLSLWITEAGQLLEEAEHVLGEVGRERTFLRSAKMRKIVNEKIEPLVVHEKKGDELFREGMAVGCGRSCGYDIPVKKLTGQVASTGLKKLQDLLRNDKVGRIAIHGMKGIGKTTIMKHLHNCVLNWVERFDYVFWVTFPNHFSIKHVQDAIAAAVKCNLCNIDDLPARAEILFRTLADCGNFVLFFDAIPEKTFSLEEVGIPVPREGNGCKLVLTTNSTSVCDMLDCLGKVELGPLSEDAAGELFMNEAKIDMGFVSPIVEISRLLVNECHGVPRKIVDIATKMCGIDDIHEWRNALDVQRNLGNENILSCHVAVNELEFGSKVKEYVKVHILSTIAVASSSTYEVRLSRN